MPPMQPINSRKPTKPPPPSSTHISAPDFLGLSGLVDFLDLRDGPSSSSSSSSAAATTSMMSSSAGITSSSSGADGFGDVFMAAVFAGPLVVVALGLVFAGTWVFAAASAFVGAGAPTRNTFAQFLHLTFLPFIASARLYAFAQLGQVVSIGIVVDPIAVGGRSDFVSSATKRGKTRIIRDSIRTRRRSLKLVESIRVNDDFNKSTVSLGSALLGEFAFFYPTFA